MRIVFDLQGIQGRSGTRGIGQYSYEVVKELCAQLTGHEIYFLVNSCLELQQDRVREIRRIRPDGVWLTLDFPTVAGEFTDNLKGAAFDIRSEILKTIAPDWVHICSVVEGYSEPVVGHAFGEYLSTCFFYDAIPAIYPEKFLPIPPIAKWYWERAATYRDYDAIFAISSIAKEEATTYLGISKDIITTIWGGLNHRKFRNIDSPNQKNITYLGSFEERKNLPRLIEAFADALPNLEDSVELVLVGKYHGSEREEVDSVIKAKNIENRVSITGYVSDLEIENIFENTKLVVFPSLHEGLGLPLLEAMGRGIPAVASNVSSMEVILQGMDNTFDPLSVSSISEKIEHFMNDSSSRKKVVTEFNKRRQQYSWERAAAELLSVVTRLPKKQKFNKSFDKSAVRSMLDNNIRVISDWKLDDSEREEAVRVLSRNFKVMLELAPIAKIGEKPEYAIAGHFTGSYSLSQLNRNVFLASQKMNIRSAFIPEYYNETIEGFSPDYSFDPREYDSEFMQEKGEISSDSIILRNAYPPIANDMRGRLNIFHTFNWEETEFPQEYVAEFNHFLDGITLATSFVQKTLIDNGLGIPTRVVGASSCITSEEQLSDFPSTLRSEKFTFLHISSAFPRKGIDVLLESFGQAFTKKDNVRLVIKTFPNPHNDIEKQIRLFDVKYPNHAEVILINKESLNIEILNLYSQADCLVSPSRGEGFGLPIYEALSNGVPVIATNWGGHKDFVSSENGILVDFDFEPSGSHLGNDNSAWAEPQISSLVEGLLEMYSTPKEVSFKNEPWTTNFAKTHEFVNFIAGKKLTKPKTAFVTTYNTRCGIAEYSKGLIEYYPEEDILIFPPNSGTPIDQKREDNIRRVWVEKGDLSLLTEEILSAGVNTVIVQHNWGFFDIREFNKFIQNLKDKVNVILEMHALRDINLKVYPEFEKILPSLINASRIIVHDLKDLNLLKEYGFVENVVMIPLAFPIPIHEFDFNFHKRNEIVIGTSGFALPNKNQELIIEVAVKMKQFYEKVTVRYQCPLHTDPSSAHQIQKLEALAKNNPNIEVIIDTDFLPDDEILKKLSECDVLIYAYKDTGETSSAAVRHGISSGVPTIVTPAPIFNSNKDSVFIADGYQAEDLYSKVLFVSELLKDRDKADENAKRIFNTVVKNSRLNISLRLQGMSQGLLNMMGGPIN